MNDWLLHMTEAQRIYAVDLIDAMLHALRTMELVPTARWSNTTSLSVRCLPDRRSGASVSLSLGKVILRTPMSPRRLRFAAELVGPACPPIDGLIDGDVAVILVTLLEWRTALSPPLTSAMCADAEEMKRAYTGLLRGIVDAHRSDWELASLQWSREDGHLVRVFIRTPEGRQLGIRFANRPTARTDGTMTPELASEMDGILRGRNQAHVVELDRWQRYRLRFHATPDYLVSPTRDPMLTLRALNALPPGARLVPARAPC